MPRDSCLIFTLPREIRDEIYHCILQARPGVALTVRGSKVVLRGVGDATDHRDRAIAALAPATRSCRPELFLGHAAALSRVDRRLRTDLSKFLTSIDIDVVARIHNFDFDAVIEHFEAQPREQLESFRVGEDGNARSILKLRLSGSYDFRWRNNLYRWVDFVECWVGMEGELRTAHETTHQGLETQDRLGRAPSNLVPELRSCSQAHQLGAGRLELDKVFHTLVARGNVEGLIRGGYGPNRFGWISGTTSEVIVLG